MIGLELHIIRQRV